MAVNHSGIPSSLTRLNLFAFCCLYTCRSSLHAYVTFCVCYIFSIFGSRSVGVQAPLSVALCVFSWWQIYVWGPLCWCVRSYLSLDTVFCVEYPLSLAHFVLLFGYFYAALCGLVCWTISVVILVRFVFDVAILN